MTINFVNALRLRSAAPPADAVSLAPSLHLAKPWPRSTRRTRTTPPAPPRSVPAATRPWYVPRSLSVACPHLPLLRRLAHSLSRSLAHRPRHEWSQLSWWSQLHAAVPSLSSPKRRAVGAGLDRPTCTRPRTVARRPPAPILNAACSLPRLHAVLPFCALRAPHPSRCLRRIMRVRGANSERSRAERARGRGEASRGATHTTKRSRGVR